MATPSNLDIMSFQFNWPVLDDDQKSSIKALLEDAINGTATLPQPLTGRILVTSFDIGSTAPELEFMEIGEVTLETFRALLRLSYNGDASISLRLQLHTPPVHVDVSVGQVRIDALLSLLASKHSGVTITFRSDPIESLAVGTSFDGLPAVKDLIQREAETRVREALRTQIPSLIHEETKRMFGDFAVPRRESLVEDTRWRSTSESGLIRIITAPRPRTDSEVSTYDAIKRWETASQAPSTASTSRFTQISRISTATSSLYSASTSHHAAPAGISLKKRMEILRAKYSSLSPVQSLDGMVVHQAAAGLKEGLGTSSRPDSPEHLNLSSPRYHDR